jgi:hypothetical protein
MAGLSSLRDRLDGPAAWPSRLFRIGVSHHLIRGFPMNAWLIDFLLSPLRSLGGSIVSSLGLGGVIAVLAGGLLLLSLPFGLLRFVSRPRGMVLAAAVMLGGLAVTFLGGAPAASPVTQETPAEEENVLAGLDFDPAARIHEPAPAVDLTDTIPMIAGDVPTIAPPQLPMAMAALPAIMPAIVPGIASHHAGAPAGGHTASTHSATHSSVAARAPVAPQGHINPRGFEMLDSHPASHAGTPATQPLHHASSTQEAGSAASGKNPYAAELKAAQARSAALDERLDASREERLNWAVNGHGKHAGEGAEGSASGGGHGGRMPGTSGHAAGGSFGLGGGYPHVAGNRGTTHANGGHNTQAAQQRINQSVDHQLNMMMQNMMNEHLGGSGTHPMGGMHPGGMGHNASMTHHGGHH